VVTFPEELGENFIKQLAKFGFYHFPDASVPGPARIS
jgi:hypothetical protein